MLDDEYKEIHHWDDKTTRVALRSLDRKRLWSVANAFSAVIELPAEDPRTSGEVIGLISLGARPGADSRLWIGVHLSRPHRGNGHLSEDLQVVLPAMKEAGLELGYLACDLDSAAMMGLEDNEYLHPNGGTTMATTFVWPSEVAQTAQ